MSKGITTTKRAIEKLKADEARLRDKIKQQKQQLKQAEDAQKKRQALALGRIAMELLPEPFYSAEVFTGMCLSVRHASLGAMDAWREKGRLHLKPEGGNQE